ncbi:MAG: MBL fold metallo-hydrolase [Bacteroidota bacterium]
MKGSKFKLPNTLVVAFALALAATGCSSYITRIASYSIQNLWAPIAPALHKETSPILPDVGLSVLWVGHATVLIQIHDKVFLTDPVFTNTIGMIVRRSTEPGIDVASLSRVDYTLISHLHLDHFSFGSLDMLPKDGVLLVPNGGAEYTPEFGFRETREMQWWDVMEERGVRITSVPVQHFSGRYGFDGGWNAGRNFTGWVIEYMGKTVFIAGDTGYNPEMFKEIGRRFPIDVAIVPIAPSRSEGLGMGVHVSPRGAVQIFEDVHAKWLVPMHYRTFFQGSDAPPTEAQESLKRVAVEKGIQDRVKILDFGERCILDPTPILNAPASGDLGSVTNLTTQLSTDLSLTN